MFYDCLKEVKSTDSCVLCSTIDHPIAEHCLYVNGEVMCSTEQYPSGAGKEDVFGRGVCVLDEGGNRIFREVLESRKRTVICGGGHVAQALIRILSILGIETIVLEDRANFGAQAEKNGASKVLIGRYAELLRNLDPGKDACYVVMTRGHRYDMECLYEILNREYTYAGMMTSKMRVAAAIDLMRSRGVTEEKLASLHAPIGIKIGSETPEEIAISVAAEIIKTIHETGKRTMPKEIVNALTEDSPRVLAEIITRKGPAPRLPGTKMVIFRDGRLVGTIGGGCLEAEVIRRARDLLATDGAPEIVTIDLTQKGDTKEDGMACGGVMDVLLEPIFP